MATTLLQLQVLLAIFSYLDDISLYAVGSVCRRWRQILTTNYFPARWREFTARWEQRVFRLVTKLIRVCLVFLTCLSKAITQTACRYLSASGWSAI
jgi:hypothetical protein